ncbi:unnamed protein product [Trichogramma brassicae]|uniref:Uncharacterized protein n=1 Tax=Trichogramma brassicae TaxID=86971 RepID=A0A6H5IP28_9HYME|nr:unnamed protein product [Trichogramma brassicae]
MCAARLTVIRDVAVGRVVPAVTSPRVVRWRRRSDSRRPGPTTPGATSLATAGSDELARDYGELLNSSTELCKLLRDLVRRRLGPPGRLARCHNRRADLMSLVSHCRKILERLISDDEKQASHLRRQKVQPSASKHVVAHICRRGQRPHVT